jgi:Zn-dependent M16 (insulinase) family peptidase
VVRGKPSASLADKLESDEKARVAAQVARLGADGLKNAKKVLEEAKEEHEKPIPTELLLDFAVPSVKSIAFIPVQSLQEQGRGRAASMKAIESEPLTAHIQSDGSPLPFFVQYDHVEVSDNFLFA